MYLVFVGDKIYLHGVLCCSPFQIYAQPAPTHHVPLLIGDGTPVSLCILICSNDEPAKGPLHFLNALAGGMYKFWKRMRTFTKFAWGSTDFGSFAVELCPAFKL